jgi:hypothetical protein
VLKNNGEVMAYKPSLNIANFTCRFGENKVLLDLFQEIIYPAFFESNPREYAKNIFYLFNLEFKNVEENEPVIAGRFVRDTDLTRSHVLRDNKLVPSSDQIESATSARFVLILSSHTLLYVPETPKAPPLAMFQSTMQYHLKKSWASYIKSESRRQRKANPKGPKIRDIYIKLAEEIPPPQLNLIELPSSISIKDFLEKFKQIDQVEYRINDTNHNNDFMPLINALREQKKDTGSSSIIVIERKPTNKDTLTTQLNDATRAGNVDAKIAGKGLNGEKISGSNEEFKLSIPLGVVPASMNQFITTVYKVFKNLISTKEISIQKATGLYSNKLIEIAQEIRNE